MTGVDSVNNEKQKMRRKTVAQSMTPALERFTRTFAESQVVFRENDPGNEMYIVHSGKVGLYKEQEKGRALLAIVGPGDFFGEMALVDGSPRSATAIATEDASRLVALDRAKFLYLLRHQPEFALIMMERLCQRLRHATAVIGAGTVGPKKPGRM